MVLFETKTFDILRLRVLNHPTKTCEVTDIDNQDEKFSNLTILLADYLEACSSQDEPRFPNLAGFCRFADILPEELFGAAKSGVRAASNVVLALEDEAYNSDAISSSLAAAYLKRQLWQEHGRERYGGGDADGVQLSFYHDISEDGL